MSDYSTSNYNSRPITIYFKSKLSESSTSSSIVFSVYSSGGTNMTTYNESFGITYGSVTHDVSPLPLPTLSRLKFDTESFYDRLARVG